MKRKSEIGLCLVLLVLTLVGYVLMPKRSEPDWTAGLVCKYEGDSVYFTTKKSVVEAHLVGPNAEKLTLNIPDDTHGSVIGTATRLDTLHVQSHSGGSDCALAR